MKSMRPVTEGTAAIWLDQVRDHGAAGCFSLRKACANSCEIQALSERFGLNRALSILRPSVFRGDERLAAFGAAVHWFGGIHEPANVVAAVLTDQESLCAEIDANLFARGFAKKVHASVNEDAEANQLRDESDDAPKQVRNPAGKQTAQIDGAIQQDEQADADGRECQLLQPGALSQFLDSFSLDIIPAQSQLGENLAQDGIPKETDIALWMMLSHGIANRYRDGADHVAEGPTGWIGSSHTGPFGMQDTPAYSACPQWRQRETPREWSFSRAVRRAMLM